MPAETALPLLPMTPLFLEKIWGGQRIRALTAKNAPSQLPNIGESWEVADLAEGQSTVASGPLAGKTLGELSRAHGARLNGTASSSAAFPLLVKLVDAGDALSVQVHPGGDYAATHPGTFSKDESWLILDADPDGYVLHGFNAGVDRDAFQRAVTEGRADQLLRRVHVKAGDVLHVAPGTVHAIGKGVLLLECQQPSDTTFRVYDYGRRDAQGKTRPLHVEQAMEVCRFGPQPPALAEGVSSRWGTLAVRSPHYQVHHVALPAFRGEPAARAFHVGLESPVVFHVAAGRAHISVEGSSVTAGAGTTVVCPPRDGLVSLAALDEQARVVAMML